MRSRAYGIGSLGLGALLSYSTPPQTSSPVERYTLFPSTTYRFQKPVATSASSENLLERLVGSGLSDSDARKLIADSHVVYDLPAASDKFDVKLSVTALEESDPANGDVSYVGFRKSLDVQPQTNFYVISKPFDNITKEDVVRASHLDRGYSSIPLDTPVKGDSLNQTCLSRYNEAWRAANSPTTTMEDRLYLQEINGKGHPLNYASKGDSIGIVTSSPQGETYMVFSIVEEYDFGKVGSDDNHPEHGTVRNGITTIRLKRFD